MKFIFKVKLHPLKKNPIFPVSSTLSDGSTYSLNWHPDLLPGMHRIHYGAYWRPK